MVRLILFLAFVTAAATGLAWLADRPGNLVINWQGYEIETSVFRAVVLLAALLGAALFVWSILRQIWSSPAAVGQFMARRRQQRGLEALSSGMIAIGAGDRSSATRYAIQARKALPNEPLTHLLRAQAAQLSGDGSTSRRIFEAMLASPDTEQLGLRGLFLEAQREKETEAARQFAERAMRLNPKLSWAVEQLFELQCKEKNWPGALETLATARRYGHVEKASADRRRAVLLTAQAIEKEDSEPDRALNLAIEAHGLAPDLVPAAALAGRMLASRGNTPRATKIIQKTWSRAPHPDLATTYAYARLGDSPRDRFDRVRQLALLNPMSVESAVAVATAAIEAKDYDAARDTLSSFVDGRLTQRICLLMARIEGEQHGDKGRVREWLARAVNAPRDPAWTADGVVSDQWAPVSPVTGALDAFQWRVPVESSELTDQELLQKKLEELVPLGAGQDPALAAKPINAEPASASSPDDTSAKPAEVMAAKPSSPVAARPGVADADIIATDTPPRTTPTPEPTPRASAQSEALAGTLAETPPAAATAQQPLPAKTMPQATAADARTGPRPAVNAPPASQPPAAEAKPAPRTEPVETAATTTPNTRQPIDVPSAAETNAKAAAAYARLSERSSRPATVAETGVAEATNGGPPVTAAPTVGGKPPERGEHNTPNANAATTRIFVSPRAPDDPGPDAGDVEDLAPTARSYHRVSR